MLIPFMVFPVCLTKKVFSLEARCICYSNIYADDTILTAHGSNKTVKWKKCEMGVCHCNTIIKTNPDFTL